MRSTLVISKPFTAPFVTCGPGTGSGVFLVHHLIIQGHDQRTMGI